MASEREPAIDALDDVWSSIGEATGDIDASAWDLATACPGWTVRDHLSHLIGIERTLLGDPQPPPATSNGPHVRNDIGVMNEAWVEERRPRPGEEVLDEWRVVAGRRLGALERMTPAEWDRVGPSPIGQVPYRQFMWLRVVDSWVHEQDMRQALGRPGGRGGPGELRTVDHVSSLMPYVIGRKVRPPDGTTVVWEVEGPSPRRIAVGVEGGRGRRLDEVPAEPELTLRLDEATFWRLGCGRVAPEVASRQVVIQGPSELAGRVIEEMNFMF